MYNEDDMLMLSGIQHFLFCPRQWALIHIDQQWDENRLTTEGQLLHKNVDNPSYRQKNGDTITLRAVSIASKRLGLYGVSDAIELHPTNDENLGIKHKSYLGNWIPYPIEFKRGKPKITDIDKVQLAAQVMCLEEMHNINIDEGAIFYGETRHREIVRIDDDLRQLTTNCAEEMHRIYSTGIIPKAQKTKQCKNCSLKDICMPELEKCSKVTTYLKSHLYEETT